MNISVGKFIGCVMIIIGSTIGAGIILLTALLQEINNPAKLEKKQIKTAAHKAALLEKAKAATSEEQPVA